MEHEPLLPVVTRENWQSQREYTARAAKKQMLRDYFEGYWAHIKRVNPIVAAKIDDMTKHRSELGHPDSGRDAWTFRSMCALYQLLERQAEADRMNEEVGS